MAKRLSDGIRSIFRTSLGLITKTSGDTNNPTNDENEERLEEESLDSNPKLLKRDAKHLDIDSLMEQKLPLKKSKDLIPVKYIDIFDEESLEDKQTVFRQNLLNKKTEYLPDLSPTTLLVDEEIELLLKQFRVTDFLILSQIWPQFKTKVCELIASQEFLWFSADQSKGRFGSHEDCCQLCDHLTDLDKSCIDLKDNNSLPQVLKSLSELSPIFSSLRCLRLFRLTIDEETDLLVTKMYPNLSHLDLTECRVLSAKHMSAHLKNLKHLILSSAEVNEEIYKLIVKKKSLQTLVANSTNITQKDLMVIPMSEKKSIERIDIRNCPKLSLNYMTKVLNCDSNLDGIKCLRLEVVFDDNAFDLMCSAFKNLEILELSASQQQNVRHFSTKGLQHISRLENLRHLKFGPNIARVPIPLMDILMGCPLITSFSIDSGNHFAQIHEKELSLIGEYWPFLKRLQLKHISRVGYPTIEGLTRCKRLSYLDLTECINLEDNCLVENLERMERLCYLVLDKCHRLTKWTFDAVVEKARKAPDSLLSVSMYKCNYFPEKYITKEELPKNLRITLSSVKAKRFLTFDGLRVKYSYNEYIHQYFNGN